MGMTYLHPAGLVIERSSWLTRSRGERGGGGAVAETHVL